MSKQSKQRRQDFERYKAKRGLSGLRFFVSWSWKGEEIRVLRENFVGSEIHCVKSFIRSVVRSDNIRFTEGDIDTFFSSYEEF